jgi:hypothetical protein
MKIIFLTNATGKDKSEFIQDNYSDRGKYFILHFDDRIESKVNDYDYTQLLDELVKNGVQSLLKGHDLVVDYAKERQEIDLNILLHSAENIGLKTEIIDFKHKYEIIQVNPDIDSKTWNRIIRTIISHYAQEIGIEEICVLGGKNALVKFYKYESNGIVIFYFATNEKCIFNHDHDFELHSNEKTVEKFMSFREAFESIQMRYRVFQLYPLRINEKYTSEFNKAYQKYMKSHKTDLKGIEWQEFLN